MEEYDSLYDFYKIPSRILRREQEKNRPGAGHNAFDLAFKYLSQIGIDLDIDLQADSHLLKRRAVAVRD